MARHPFDKRAARRAAVFITVVAGVLAGVWALPRVSAAAAGWLAAPPVRERTVAIDGGLVVAERVAPRSGGGAADARQLATARPSGAALRVRPGFTFDMVGLLCDGPTRTGVPVTVALRTSADGESWSEWCAVDLESRERLSADAADGPGAYTEPVWVGEARAPVQTVLLLLRGTSHDAAKLVHSSGSRARRRLPAGGKPGSSTSGPKR